jgi:hypothetical protein
MKRSQEANSTYNQAKNLFVKEGSKYNPIRASIVVASDSEEEEEEK